MQTVWHKKHHKLWYRAASIPMLIAVFVSALISLSSQPSFAQSDQEPSNSNQSQQLLTADGEQIFIGAEEIIYDQETRIVRARGNVEIKYGDRYVRADELFYFEGEEKLIATGNVYSISEDGEELRADFVNLNESFTEGVIEQFYVTLESEARLAAREAKRGPGPLIQLNKGVYSACPACEDNPDKPLAWQLRAESVVLDEEEQQIYYRDVYFDLLGQPILYIPYFQQADPRVDRKTGWVDWDFEWNSSLGPLLQASYFWAPQDHYDFTFTPRFHPTSGLTLDTEYNRALSLGDIKARTLLSYMPEFLNGGEPVLESYDSPFYSAFGLEGELELSPNWRLQVDGVWYTHEDLLHLHGWSTDTTQTSEFLIEGFHDRSYTQVAVEQLKSSRVSLDDDQLPTLAQLQHSYASDPWLDVVSYSLDAELRGVFRNEDRDALRASVRPEVTVAYPLNSWLEFEGSATVFSAAYLVENATDSLSGENGAVVVPYAKLGLSAPFESFDAPFQQYFRPSISVTGSSLSNQQSSFPNDDAIDVELDISNYDAMNRSSGWDRHDSGVRVNYGFDWSIHDEKRQLASVKLGQSFQFLSDDMYQEIRSKDENYFPTVGEISLDITSALNLAYSFTMDTGSFEFSKHELSAQVQRGQAQTQISYLDLKPIDPVTPDLNQLKFSTSRRFFDDFQFSGGTTYDFDTESVANRELKLSYLHDCWNFKIGYTNTPTASVNQHTLSFSVELLTLGGTELSRSF